MIPPFDPAGILTAIISAALFTVALVYVVKSRTTAIEAPLSEALTGDGYCYQRELFSSVILEPRFSGIGLMCSVAFHLVVLIGTPLLPYLFPDKLNFDSRRYTVKMMEFRVPPPLFYTPPEDPSKPKPERRPAKARIVEPAGSKSAAARKAEEQRAADRSRQRLQLPWPARAPSSDVVIQPDQPAEVSMAAHSLPTSFLWAQAPTPSEISRTVGARQQPQKTFSLPNATPIVQKPNRELAISDLQIGAAPVLTFRSPQLPVAPANNSPVRVPTNEPASELPASVLPQGDLLNLIAWMRSPAPPAFAYLLEAGNLLAEGQPGPPQPGGAGPSGSAGEGNGAGAGVGFGTGSAVTGSGTGTHADLLAVTGNGTGAGSRPGSDVKDTGQTAPTGNLGIIIVQQTAQEAVLDGSEALSGQPVYTVYFDVPGSPRRWILQYCVPGSVSASSVITANGIVRIAPRRSVQPPYPTDRFPVDLHGFQADGRRLVVYAFVDERGEMQDVRVVRGAGQAVDNSALATLKRWAFRPAMRGDTPVAVEALFGIPLQ